MNDSLNFKCVISEHYTKNYTEKIISIIEKQIKTNRKLDNYKLRNKIYTTLIREGYDNSQIINSLNLYFQ